MNKRKGFTLVELLAVIVILAIIMIIAIPSVLGTLETARQKTFVEYVTRVMEAGQNQYLTQLSSGTLPDSSKDSENCEKASAATAQCTNGDVYFYSIKNGLGLSSTGSYNGWVAIVPSSGTKVETKIFVSLYDNNYITETRVYKNETEYDPYYYVNYTEDGEPSTDSLATDPDDHVSAVANYVTKAKGTAGAFDSTIKYVPPKKA